MTNWFKEVHDCPDCKLSEDKLELKFCDKHKLTPENLKNFLPDRTWDV